MIGFEERFKRLLPEFFLFLDRGVDFADGGEGFFADLAEPVFFRAGGSVDFRGQRFEKTVVPVEI